MRNLRRLHIVSLCDHLPMTDSSLNKSTLGHLLQKYPDLREDSLQLCWKMSSRRSTNRQSCGTDLDISQQFLCIKSKLFRTYEDRVETSAHAKKLEETVKETQQRCRTALKDIPCSRKRKRTLPCGLPSFAKRLNPAPEVLFE